jgi:hypothetical protein
VLNYAIDYLRRTFDPLVIYCITQVAFLCVPPIPADAKIGLGVRPMMVLYQSLANFIPKVSNLLFSVQDQFRRHFNLPPRNAMLAKVTSGQVIPVRRQRAIGEYGYPRTVETAIQMLGEDRVKFAFASKQVHDRRGPEHDCNL